MAKNKTTLPKNSGNTPVQGPTSSQTNASHHMNPLLLLGISVLVGVGLGLGGFFLFMVMAPKQPTVIPVVTKNSGAGAVNTSSETAAAVTDSDVALALLNETDITQSLNKQNELRSNLIEFNDHLEPEDAGIPYTTFVGRVTVDKKSGLNILANSIVAHTTTAGAQKFIMGKGAELEPLNVAKSFGDKTVAYYSPKSADANASVTLRFTMKEYAMKIQVWDTAGSIEDISGAQTKLLPLAVALAPVQQMKVEKVMAGTLNFATQSQNDAMRRLPKTIIGTTFIGTSKVLDTEWMGSTRDFTNEDLPGFQSGALSRLKIDARPAEVLEVTVLEFDTADRAAEYQKKLLTTGVAVEEPGVTTIKLPESLSVEADAILQDTIAELQSAQGPFLVDVSIVSPFDTIDKVAAQQDLIDMTQQVLKAF